MALRVAGLLMPAFARQTLSTHSSFRRTVPGTSAVLLIGQRFVRSAALLLLSLLAAPSGVAAADVVHLKQPGSEAVIPTPAIIDDFTGRFLRYRLNANARPREVPTAQVDHVDHEHSQEFVRGMKLFDAGQYDEAEAVWTRELSREPKAWVQREIRAWLIRAAWRRELWGEAGRLFLDIVDADPETFHWPLAPLSWTPLVLRDADRTLAREWLADSRPVARLLGGSLLLKDAASRAEAVRALEQLVRGPIPQVSGMAKAQLWRERLVQPISDDELTSWRGHVQFLPASLRGGPQYLVASACLRRGQFDRAAAEFLWLPLVYSQHEPTTARASLEAGRR